MIKSFITSFKLKNTYRVNSVIYSIKQIPLIKKILPNSLYQSRGLKIFGNIVSSIMELGSIFLGKFLYIWLVIFSLVALFETNSRDTFLHIFFFLTLSGGLLNTFLFNPTKDKYYAMILMNMDAKKYTLSNYFYALIKVFIGFLPFVILFGSLVQIPIWVSILLPIFVISVKMIVNTYNLFQFEKTNIARNENVPDKIMWLLIILFLVFGYGFPYLKIVMPFYIFLGVSLIIIIIGMLCFFKILSFPHYKEMYRQILKPSNVYPLSNQSKEYLKESVAKQIELDNSLVSNKSGFAYFHDLFVKRHRKILINSIKKQSIVIFIFFTFLIVMVIIQPTIGSRINQLLLTYLPYFVFIMYFLNRGQVVTQAMFLNCDHSMLTYRFYRTPNVILGLFRERAKTLISINLIPAFLIGLGLPVLLYFTGGTDNYLNYIVLFVSILAISIFFSIHHLVMYYLLQPYNVNTEMKSSTFTIVQTLTYFVCYFMIQVRLPIIPFGICTILFSVIYSFVSLYIAYRYAPKTFKLRI